MEEEKKNEEPYNCLTNEKIIVRYIKQQRGIITNPDHVLFGGMAENAKRTFTVPTLLSGMYVNILNNNEKQLLEKVMGLEYNAMSVYKKENNFWDYDNPQGINKVTLNKGDNYFDLSKPEDYIKYKILLANKDYIAKSYQDMQDMPKQTYQFYIVRSEDETKQNQMKLSFTKQCFIEFGKIQDDANILKYVIETLDGRPLAATTKLDFLQSKAYDLLEADKKTFLQVVKDPMLNVKVLIRQAVEYGLIYKKGDWYYLKADGSPLCEANEEPTFSVAAKFISNPKHLEVKFSLEAKLKE